MWIEEVTLENVKCFQSQTIKLGDKDKPYPWVTFLGENGTGKTTVLQAIGLLLVGSRTAGNFLKNGQVGSWVRDIEKNGHGRVSCRLLRTADDKLVVNELIPQRDKEILDFNSSLFLTGKKGDKILGVVLHPYTIVSDFQAFSIHLPGRSILEDTLYGLDPEGWFCAGYGAFRRLSKEGAFNSKRPEFDRTANFRFLFHENESVDTFEQWLMYLDYVILKNNHITDKNHLEIAKKAINTLLPEGNTIEGADIDGKIWFNTPQGRVPTIALSDGFRSILALAGDLIWRMIQAFPKSENPLKEQGVVVIDELDIHLHPKWQRTIAGLLRKTFPNIQFIVATHSPIVAAGAGSDAVTYGFYQEGDQTKVERIDHLWAQSVDDILKSPAFGLVSEFSEETQEKIDTYLRLKDKKKRSKQDEHLYQLTIPFVREALGPGMEKTELELEIDSYIKEHLK